MSASTNQEVKTTKIYALNTPLMTSILRDSFLPTIEYETFSNAGHLSSKFGNENFGSSTIMTETGKKDFYINRNSTVGSWGSMGDYNTFDKGNKKYIGTRGVIRTKPFQANMNINVIEWKRMQSPEAIIDLFADQTQSVINTGKRQYGRMLYGDGKGIITTVNEKNNVNLFEGSGATAKTIKKPFSFKVADIKRFLVGDIITIPLNGLTTPAIYKKDGMYQAAGAITYTTQNIPEKGGANSKKTGQIETNPNRGATHGAGSIDDSIRAKLLTVKIKDIDYQTATLWVEPEFGGDTFFTEKKDGKITTTSFIKNDAPIFYRRTINEDMIGLDYVIKDSKDNEANKAGYCGIGEKSIGIDKDGEKIALSGEGKRPSWMLSQVYKANTFLNEHDFQIHLDNVEMLSNGNMPNVYVTAKPLLRAIATTLQPTQGMIRVTRPSTQRSSKDVRTFGYNSEVDIQGQFIDTDLFAPTTTKEGSETIGTIWTLNLNTFSLVKEQGWTFDDYNGVIWKQAFENGKRSLTYEANMYEMKNMFCSKPQYNGKIKIKDPKILTPDAPTGTPEDVKDLGQGQKGQQ